MKNQTFGVEVEMNNITRDRAAKVAATFFGTNRYADTHYTNGYWTWSAWDAQGREWKFQRDASIAGPDNKKCEMVTPILKYEDMETLQEVVRQLRRAGAKSDDTRGCGVHIHIGADGHDAKTLRNLVNMMYAHEDLIIKAMAVNNYRLRTYCKTVDQNFINQLNARKPKTMTELADVWYKSQHCDFGRNQHYNDSRYHMLNLHATFTKGTIEFRLFQFYRPTNGHRSGLHAGQLKAYIQFCLALSDAAKKAKGSRPVKTQMDNEKYAMAGWLSRMGLTGDEFKTLRKVFNERLTGNPAKRYVNVA